MSVNVAARGPGNLPLRWLPGRTCPRMDLPGRLRSTTLGDLLGALHRSRVKGTLELAEDSGRRHRVYLAQGLVAAVELDAVEPVAGGDPARRSRGGGRRPAPLAAAGHGLERLHGEVLVDDFRLSPEVVGNALRRQVARAPRGARRLADARVSFRVAVRPPRGVLSSRGATPRAARVPARAAAASRAGAARRAHARARRLSEGGRSEGVEHARLAPRRAGLTEIKRAYRRLARTVHPDLHPGASDEERRASAGSLRRDHRRVPRARGVRAR